MAHERFREAMEESGLTNFKFDGHQFTWEKSRGKPGWIQAKLDRILVLDAWRDLFQGATTSSIITSRSDHMPLFIQTESQVFSQCRRRFKFENLWLKEGQCRDVVIQSWNSTRGLKLLERFEICGKSVW
ncbi:PREDICTED: uncharacterized protein LOC109190356 [Ipomoea nil]|uniref:uncharacterized protein LOC109190356 n=1 Tax=Ipomoea nil TaxID=35883 RepID=UPI000900FD38|nr:PREDICTED: uncharacterized protein LOC109190356 [Ipomoea nil]